MMSNNRQAAAAVLTSGNNFSKIENFAKHLGLEFISASTFQRVQKLYYAPVIDEWWQNMREELWAQFASEQLSDVVMASVTPLAFQPKTFATM